MDTGKCLTVIPISEMDVTGMNLSKAVMDEKTARLLYYNGAEVPKHYQTKLAQELNPDREE